MNYLVALKALIILNEPDIEINHDILRDISHDLIFLKDFKELDKVFSGMNENTDLWGQIEKFMSSLKTVQHVNLFGQSVSFTSDQISNINCEHMSDRDSVQPED